MPFSVSVESCSPLAAPPPPPHRSSPLGRSLFARLRRSPVCRWPGCGFRRKQGRFTGLAVTADDSPGTVYRSSCIASQPLRSTVSYGPLVCCSASVENADVLADSNKAVLFECTEWNERLAMFLKHGFTILFCLASRLMTFNTPTGRGKNNL